MSRNIVLLHPTVPSASELTPHPREWVVVFGYHPLLERNNGVVGDLDLLRTHLGTTLGDVAHADPCAGLEQLQPIVGVERMHLQRGQPDKKTRAGKTGFVALVVANDVAHVLTQEALDALVELLHAIDVFLEHTPRTVGLARPRPERRDGLGL